MKLWEVFRFEVAYQLRRPLTWPELTELIDKLGFEPQIQELN